MNNAAEMDFGVGSFDVIEEQDAVVYSIEDNEELASREKKQIKEHAGSVNDAASWTQKILEGDARFASTSDHTEQQLAQATYGLKTHAEFRETRARLEEEEQAAAAAEAQEVEARRVAAAEEKRQRQKRKRREQASKLSFEDEDG